MPTPWHCSSLCWADSLWALIPCLSRPLKNRCLARCPEAPSVVKVDPHPVIFQFYKLLSSHMT